MWGLQLISPWLPWPHSRPPELRFSDGSGNLIILLGAEGTPRGRYGVVGRPREITRLSHTHAVAPLFDARPKDALRIIGLGYELGNAQVYLPPTAPPRGQPAGFFADLREGLLVDHKRRRLAVFGGPHTDVAQWLEPLNTADAADTTEDYADWQVTVSDDEHGERIRRTLAHITEGDIYQANIARRIKLSGIDAERFGGRALRALADINPVAHGAYIRSGGFELLSNSMETLLTYDPITREAASYPIKGTCARPDDALHDGLRAANHLRMHPKERAEHIMIVDLVRNDLGRVAEGGSVRVPQMMEVVGYRGVWHGVSKVEARLADDAGLGALVASLFPGGSITGAPKRRAMQIIAELETEPRGFYTGSLGFVAPNGACSLSILIRTLVRDDDDWSVSVGGGIVADSTPERELAETWEKVAVVRRLFGDRSREKLREG